ncbi:MAG: 2-phosphosulfolactate phosphatase [Bacteroidota bacterium]
MPLQADVFLTYAHVTPEDVHGRSVVIIDVFRASSTIVTALHQGARAIIPVQDSAEAGKITSHLDQDSYLLAGERGGEQIEGYHLGNSPLSFTPDQVTGQIILLNTTNGTQAVAHAQESTHMVIGCFLNVSSVVSFLEAADRPITLVCAGWRRRVSLEDTLCAGLLLDRLWGGQPPAKLSDAVQVAYGQYERAAADLHGALLRCDHAQRLISMGAADDVQYCTQVDALNALPYYRDRQLTLLSNWSSVLSSAA